MARSDPRRRLSELADAATVVFGRQGYHRTRTAEIAAEAGMASGSVFNYVESKEALFYLVFAHGFGALDAADPDLPIATPAPGETVALISQHLRKVQTPCLTAALDNQNPIDPGAELRGIVEERYDMLETLWPLLAVIERSAVDFPDLEEFYFRRLRVRYHDRLAKYLEQRAADGQLRLTPDSTLTARIVDESVTWFAWKRHEGRDAQRFDDELARETVMDFVCSALAAGLQASDRGDR
jgi:AcrR family transcriptional regulator